MKDEELRRLVSEHYGKAGKAAAAGAKGRCCGPGCCGGSDSGALDSISRDLYEDQEVSQLPEQAVLASLGCGNPSALAKLGRGEVVLDLGSGGGLDVLLSAKRVGPTGMAYGLDRTNEMLALALEHRRKSGLPNVVFLKGDMEKIPLPDDSVDVVISNCVINLSADKDQVFREAFRVLRPGGRLAVSDIAVRGGVPGEIRKSLELWMGCLAGALEESEYCTKLEGAGFSEVGLEVTRVYNAQDARALQLGFGTDPLPDPSQGAGTFISAFVRAKKPV
jgi:SAM-dependent methyltransferase